MIPLIRSVPRPLSIGWPNVSGDDSGLISRHFWLLPKLPLLTLHGHASVEVARSVTLTRIVLVWLIARCTVALVSIGQIAAMMLTWPEVVIKNFIGLPLFTLS